MAFTVRPRLTSRLSQNSLAESSRIKAAATLPGLGINPFDTVCHINTVTTTCTAISIANVFLLIVAKGLNMFMLSSLNDYIIFFA